MPSRESIVSFEEPPAPEGADPYVNGAGPSPGIAVVPPRAEWPGLFETLAARIRSALGWRALTVEHVGSTSVQGLSAKPTIDIDLIVADPDREEDYVPALEQQGFVLRVREPWWFGHRMLALQEPACHLHVFGPDSPEPVKHRIFRDWLRGNPDDRERYEAVKLRASAEATAAGEHSMEYNARKESVIREIYDRAFRAAGLLR
ncbi:GrpB family protein [Arthrobacter woluwensis]|jgi:GrpB-like predicted nucleotidyltransferase (UPF0157 family)|uniref:GrpB family protein n=1 Tax=Arthrobacter woluwensis TaxID=156980 RepID=UPI001AAEE0FC|nr:GrpB family protein [Arthrobacter woluwensis]QTF72805.1 GrpB family protein [Arthrobacter woluwensis]